SRHAAVRTARADREAALLTACRTCPAILPFRLDRRPCFARGFAPLDRLALVVLFLALRGRHRHLDAAVLEVETRRHERHALLDRLADQLADLVAVQQELAPAQRLVIGVAAMAVRADVDVVEEDLAVLDAREAVAEVHAAFADRFHLGAEQDEAGFEGLEQMEVVKGLPVLGDVFLGELALGFFSHVMQVAGLQADRARRAANNVADTMLSASATPLPAMSNAVP